MNQILSTNMPKGEKPKRERGPIAIGSILKFFAITTIIFGICMVGTGVYALQQNQAQEEIENADPVISLEDKTESTIILQVTHNKNISKVSYYWNEETPTTVNGKGGGYLETEITVPTGQNVLHVIVQDETGKQTSFDKEYDVESAIQITDIGGKLQISYESTTGKKVSYMTYRWDDQSEKTIEINKKSVKEEIDALSGLHTLTVVMVDEDNKTETKEQQVNGLLKPEIKIGMTGNYFTVKATSETNLTKVEIMIDNNQNKKYRINLDGKNMKQFNYTLKTLKMHKGDNFIKVTAYNTDNLEGTGAAKYTKK